MGEKARSGAGASAEMPSPHEYVYDHRCTRIINGETCYRVGGDPVHLTDDSAPKANRYQHSQHGTVIHVEFPPEAPFEVVEAAMDAVVKATDVERDGWDPFIYATRRPRRAK